MTTLDGVYESSICFLLFVCLLILTLKINMGDTIISFLMDKVKGQRP